MKIVYDISLLGTGYQRPKTGLHRVAEVLASKLIDSQECELTFCTTLFLDVWSDSLKYLKNNSELVNIPLLNEETSFGNRVKVYNFFVRSIECFYKSGLIKHKNFPETLLKILHYKFQPVSNKALKEQNIFHSPYHRIPDEVKSVKNIKKFLTVHDLIPILFPDYFGTHKDLCKYKFPRNFNLQQAIDCIDPDTWIFCVSHATKNDLKNYLKNKVDENKIVVNHLAASQLFYPCLDPQKTAQVKQKYGIPESPYILSLCTLEPRKNLVHTIQCFANLIKQEKLNDLYLVLAGYKGWDYGSIFKAIAECPQLQKQIIPIGYVADKDLAALYSGALVFVYPSLYEGFGLPPLEAMQCGTPTITSNTSSLPEVVGDAGIMVDPIDKDLLSQHMLQVYHSSSLRTELSQRSIERAKQFSWSKFTQQTIAAYQKSLG